jgi:hypothetical protein
MSDSTYTDIVIGGKLDEALVPEFLKLLRCLCTDEGKYDEKMIEDYIADNQIYAWDPEASGGELPLIQKFCRDHNLPYIMRTYAGDGIDAMETWFEQDSEYLKCVSLIDGSVYADAETLQALDDLLFSGLVDTARSVIKDKLKRAPPVPDFEIVKTGAVNE